MLYFLLFSGYKPVRVYNMTYSSLINAYVQFICTLSLQTLGYLSAPEKSWNFKDSFQFPRARQIILDTHSPWKAYDELIGHLPCPAQQFPTVFDLACGPPTVTTSQIAIEWTMAPTLCVSVWCPWCDKSAPHILDGTHGPMQTLADALDCPTCSRLVWPFKSALAHQQAATPPAPRSKDRNNILYFPTLQERSPRNV